MEKDLFAHLPSESTTDIVSRLSLRNIALSMCVCKPWLDLIESDDFANFHLSKSAAALAVSIPATRDLNWCKVFELGDGDLESENPITKFDFPLTASFHGSADGLIFLSFFGVSFDALYVCNPITREFIELHCREEFVHSTQFSQIAYGFGASKVTGKHKVVWINCASDHCHVYTLGTAQWRRVEAVTGSATSAVRGTFVNGNLYWKVSGSKSETSICCFDLETERFSTVSPPPVRGSLLHFRLVTLVDCLCAVDDSIDNEIMLWLLEECGGEKSWTMAYVIDQNPDRVTCGFDSLRPINVLRNGEILILCDERTHFRYSIEEKTYQEVPSFGAGGRRFVGSLLLTPSFRSLKTSFGMENVISF